MGFVRRFRWKLNKKVDKSHKGWICCDFWTHYEHILLLLNTRCVGVLCVCAWWVYETTEKTQLEHGSISEVFIYSLSSKTTLSFFFVLCVPMKRWGASCRIWNREKLILLHKNDSAKRRSPSERMWEREKYTGASEFRLHTHTTVVCVWWWWRNLRCFCVGSGIRATFDLIFVWHAAITTCSSWCDYPKILSSRFGTIKHRLMLVLQPLCMHYVDLN